jgi:hypothetical protein
VVALMENFSLHCYMQNIYTCTDLDDVLDPLSRHAHTQPEVQYLQVGQLGERPQHRVRDDVPVCDLHLNDVPVETVWM